MAANDYKRLLDQAKMELATMEAHQADLTGQLNELATRIEDQKEGIRGLAKLSDQRNATELPIDAVRPLASVKSLTDATRFVLKTSRKALTPVEVRNQMDYWGYDLSKYRATFLPSLHTVLKRLVDSDEIRSVRAPNGKIAYEWITEAIRVENIIK